MSCPSVYLQFACVCQFTRYLSIANNLHYWQQNVASCCQLRSPSFLHLQISTRRRFVKNDGWFSQVTNRPPVPVSAYQYGTIGSHWMDFHEIWDLNNFQYLSIKINFRLNLTIIFQKLFSENRTLVRSNMEITVTAGQNTDDNTIWRMLFAFRITEATNTHCDNVIISNLQWKQWLSQHRS
jgi:hypothetical protein